MECTIEKEAHRFLTINIEDDYRKIPNGTILKNNRIYLLVLSLLKPI